MTIHRQTMIIRTTATLLAAFLMPLAVAAAKPAKGDNPATSKTSGAVAEEIRRADSKTGDADATRMLVVSVEGALPERGATLSLLSRKSNSMKDYLDLLRRAREDATIRGVALRMGDASMGMASAQELRQAVAELRAKGKKTTALLETDSQAAYLVAAACEEVIMPPSGNLMLHGVKADAYFLRGLLAQVGVRADVVHIGQYKAAGEMFTEDSFTSPARANMTELVDDLYAEMIGAIADSRKLTTETAEAVINAGPMSADEAKKAGLIDRVAYSDEVAAEWRKADITLLEPDDYDKSGAGKSLDMNALSLLLGMNRPAATISSDSTLPQVAVLYAVGPIVSGSSASLLGAEEQIAADDFMEALDEIQKDPKIRAVILRVNSPGGSAFASDLIWRKVDEVKKHKPVVASMADVAASGGYYIAMGANKVIAQPGTLTGSIGVVGGKADLAGLYSKLGVTKESISRGAYAGLLSETGGFTPKEREAVERMMRQTYDDFVAKAAAGRGKTPAQMNELAQGRVWSGERAKQVGLVDDLGGMSRAVEETKLLLGMKTSDKVALVSYPKDMNLMDVLRKTLGRDVSAAAGSAMPQVDLLPPALAGVLGHARTIARMMQHERVLMLAPFLTVVR